MDRDSLFLFRSLNLAIHTIICCYTMAKGVSLANTARVPSHLSCSDLLIQLVCSQLTWQRSEIVEDAVGTGFSFSPLS